MMTIRNQIAVLLLGTAAAGCATSQPAGHTHAPAPARADTAAHGHAGMHHPAMGHDSMHAAHHAPGANHDSIHAAHHGAGGHPGHPMGDARDGTAGGHDAAGQTPMPGTEHEMWMRPLGGGWSVMGMAQAFPAVTAGAPGEDGSPLRETEAYLSQPAAMLNLESPGSRWVLRTTLNAEGVTLEDGELTFGGWGEGFLDKRHPHTLLHEAMLSLNFWELGDAAASISAGKGFAPYGTDDPMMRPGFKYPTNHHLSQILERWTLAGAVLWNGWSAEASVFGGQEPEGPYDLSNIESFGNSWSARVARRWGDGWGPLAPWELSASYGRVVEEHHGEEDATALVNAALRHASRYGFGTLYALAEASRSEPEGEDDGYWSLLGETQLGLGRHAPYYRVEYAVRPEYAREGAAGTDGFFRYDHDSHATGATRWLINTAGYGYTLTGLPVSARPFVEASHHLVRAERGGIDPEALLGTDSFWSLSAGFRIFLGGGPMRMGAYGVLDPMSVMHRAPGAATDHGAHQGH
jgi:hypothetical protein